MTVEIIEYRELLRVEHHHVLLNLSWPSKTNAIIYFNDNPSDDSVTLIFHVGLIEQDFGWVFVENKFNGWHMWEKCGCESEILKFKHLNLKGPQVWFFKVDGSYKTPQDLAKEIIFRLEVYLHYAE